MSSLFSFLREREETADTTPPAAPNFSSLAATDEGSLQIYHGKPAQEVILTAIRKELEVFIHANEDPLPDPNFSFTRIQEKPTGLGNRIGQEQLSHFAFALKGNRLEAGVRFQLWGDTPAAVDQTIDTLHSELLAARESLRAKGFLRITADQSSVSEHVSSLSAWRGTAVYHILYEFYYVDSDGADSLIARIPIDIATDLDDESTVVTDEMVRWDELTAPDLSVRGRFTIGRLSLLAYVPGDTPTNMITLTRTFDGASNLPETFTTLPEFIAAVSDPASPNRNAQISFNDLAAFLAALTPDGDPIILGDVEENNTPDSYQAYLLNLSPPLHLPNSAERLELSCQGSPLNPAAVVYAQVKR